MAIPDELKIRAMAAPGVIALTEAEYDAHQEVIQGLGDRLGLRLSDKDDADTLMDYAFLGLLWAEGALTEGPDDAPVIGRDD